VLDRLALRIWLESLSFAVLETRSLSLEMCFASLTRVADVLFAASPERLILVSVAAFGELLPFRLDTEGL